MRIFRLDEMAKPVSAKTCTKCGQPITDKNYYYYKGGYNHKGGCPAAGAAPSALAATPASPNTQKASIPRSVAPARPSAQPSQYEKTVNWLKTHGITDYVINPDTGLVDVDNDVDLDVEDILQLPVKFGAVKGNFSVGGSDIATLVGCPSVVEGSFNCSHTNIKNFIGGPQQVGRSYLARNCDHLTSLEGLPRRVPGTLDLLGDTSKFKTLDGISEEIGILKLPATEWSGHNVHKMIKKIRNGVMFEFHAERKSSHWLGFLLIDGMRDGFSIISDGNKLANILNDALDTREKTAKTKGTQQDPNAPPKLPYRDILAIQEQLSDGYGRIAKL